MEFSVMTFNIHHGRSVHKQLNLEEIANVITDSKADIVGLNEVDRFFSKRSNFVDQVGWLAKKLEMNHAFTPSISIKKKGHREDRQYGNALLSRYPIVTKKDHHFNFAKGLVEGRSMLEAKIQIGDRLIQTYVTHLSIHPYFHLKQIHAIIRELKKTRDPVVVMGDWNMNPHSRGWRDMAGFMQDAWIAGGEGIGYTYPSHKPRRRLDYIFASNSLLVVEANVLHDKPEVSDHLAVKIRVRLQGENHEQVEPSQV